MSFVVAPFILLDFANCITLWSRLYFYTIIGIVATLVFFNSPAKSLLTRRLSKRNKKAPVVTAPGKPSEREAANDAAAAKAREKAQADAKEVRAGETPFTEQPLGLPNDLAQDVEDAVHEMKKEIETRRRRGSLVTMPTGAELRIALEQKLGKALSDMQ
ncbi:hypothetical protein FQN49_004509 [Arthroderma sp. PD_2]|nr:hypothetical protein FQN49_004509 [Arthroderma sp. PD_2]